MQEELFLFFHKMYCSEFLKRIDNESELLKNQIGTRISTKNTRCNVTFSSIPRTLVLLFVMNGAHLTIKQQCAELSSECQRRDSLISFSFQTFSFQLPCELPETVCG